MRGWKPAQWPITRAAKHVRGCSKGGVDGAHAMYIAPGRSLLNYRTVHYVPYIKHGATLG